MRVVSHIKNHGGLPGQNLETPWQIHECKAISDGLGVHGEPVMQRFEGGQHAGRIDELVHAAQSASQLKKWDLTTSAAIDIGAVSERAVARAAYPRIAR